MEQYSLANKDWESVFKDFSEIFISVKFSFHVGFTFDQFIEMKEVMFKLDKVFFTYIRSCNSLLKSFLLFTRKACFADTYFDHKVVF